MLIKNSKEKKSIVNKERIKKETLEDFNLIPEFRELLFKLWSLPSWEKDISEDIAWLKEILKFWEIPPLDIVECRGWWIDRAKQDPKIKHSKGQWKRRIRNWMEHKLPALRPDGGFQTGAEILREIIKR